MNLTNEDQFTEKVREHLNRSLPDAYQVKKQARLRYALIYDSTGELWPPKAASPFTFRTDILISRGPVPLVALELKWMRYSTDAVIAYSARGARYKELYPYLRFGFVIGKKAVIGRKFFVHSRDFDFALVLRDPDSDMGNLEKIVKDQLQLAEAMLRLVDRSSSSIGKTAVTCWQNGSEPIWAPAVAAEDEDEE